MVFVLERLGVAFVMIAHDDRLAPWTDRILRIEDGRMRELGKEEHRARTAGKLTGLPAGGMP